MTTPTSTTEAPTIKTNAATTTFRKTTNTAPPIPSESLVLSAINTLLNTRLSQLNDSVKVVNITYEKISETSYGVIFKFNLMNITMPEDPDLRSNTYQQVQDVINNALNTLLNEPDSQVFAPISSNFTSTSNQIAGSMEYSFHDGDLIQPISFLNELRLLMGLTTTPMSSVTTSSSPVSSPKQVSGSALVTSKLLFNSSSPVPSEALVLRAVTTLLNSRQSQLSKSVEVVNITYEKISETSYRVIFTFNLMNITMPEDPDLRSNTYQQVQDVINNALNTLLNEPDSQVFAPISSNFTSTSNQIAGRMEYSFHDGDLIQPISFLNELRLLMGLTTTPMSSVTTSSSPVSSPKQVSGSALVTSKLLFNSSSPVPSEALVLRAVTTLLNSRQSQLSKSVEVVNITYEKISETSYRVIFTFNLMNITMPEDPDLRSNTYQQVQDVINNALNTLLNEPDSQVFAPISYNFTSTSNQIAGRMEYSFHDGDLIQPISFLNELRLLMGLITTPMSSVTTSSSPVSSPKQVSGSALVTSKLLFSSSSPVPSEALVLRAVTTLLNSRQSQLSKSVEVVNITYEKISETSYRVIFTFNLMNITMPEDPDLRSNTYQQVQDVINNALNTLLNEPDSQVFAPISSNFTSTSNQIAGRMEYSFHDGDLIQPISFLNELRLLMGLTTTPMSSVTTSSSPVSSPNQVSGSALVTSKLLFSSSSPVPSEALVLRAVTTLLNSRQSQLSKSVEVVNITYEKISETSYRVIFTFNLMNITMPEDPDLRSNTYQQVQDVINNALNTLLNEPDSQVFAPISSNFTSTSNQIAGSMEYSFHDGDLIQPISFLNELRLLMGLTTTPMSSVTTSSSPMSFPNQVSGSALVRSKLLFNSSSPVPSEALVLHAVTTLLNSRQSQLSKSVEVVNITYEKISVTSYGVIFTFNLMNITMPEDSDLRGNTYQQVQDVINNALNTLLNEPDSQVFAPISSNFTSTSNQIAGSMEYSFHDGDLIQPISFLNELRLLMGLTTTPMSSVTTSSSPMSFPNQVSGSALVTSKLLFNSSSPVPSEALVLHAVTTLLNSRQSQLSKSVEVVNITYEKISETSYGVIFTFNLMNITMPGDSDLRGNTYQQVQDVINNALNTLLNEPDSQVFAPISSNFTSTSNQIAGSMEYSFHDGDLIQPISFLNELRLLMGLTTTPMSSVTTSSSPMSSPNQVSGSALVTSKLLFNSSSPVPSEALVLRAVTTLLNSRQSQLSKSVEVVNITYEKISETSYRVIFTFNLMNITMPEDPDLRSNTYQQVQDVINNALNTLLNEPDSQVFAPISSNFTSTSNQIAGSMEYSFHDGDLIQPISFLNELRLLMGLTTTPMSSVTTSSSPMSSPNQVIPFRSGSALVTSKLLFNSSSPVPSEALVLHAVTTLLNSRQSQLSKSVEVVNITYEKISETSYGVIFTFNLMNITMPGDSDLRGNTYQQVQDVINNVLNTLLNEPDSQVFAPISSNFTSTSNQIAGSMEYSFHDGDLIQPISFLNELRLLMGLTTTPVFSVTTSSSPVSSLNQVSGSALVTSKLLFISSSPVPSEALVLSAVTTLRNSRLSLLSKSVEVVNITYEKISETSYSVIFTFSLMNISMPKDPKLRRNTYQQVQNIINNALNTLLNEPGNQFFVPIFSNFTHTENLIEGRMEYIFKDEPASFLKELQSRLIPTTTATAGITSQTITESMTVVGKAIIYIRLIFITLGPIPSKSKVLEIANSMLEPHLRTKRDVTTQILSDPVSFLNVTYERISDNSYALKFGFEISNVSMTEKLELRNGTYNFIQTSINSLLNKILNSNSANPFVFQKANFSGNSTVIIADVIYTFSEKDIKTPSAFVKELLQVTQSLTTPSPVNRTSQKPGETLTLVGKAIIYIRLIFNTLGPIPSESKVLQVANSMLAARLRTKQNLRAQTLGDPVSFVNVTYKRISDRSYSLNFGFEISGVTMSEKLELRNSTYALIEKSINALLNEILSSPSATPFVFNGAKFKGNSTVIEADVEYVFSESDIKTPSPFLSALITVNTETIIPVTFYPIVLNTTISNNSTNAAWVVAIIVPCAIAIILVPCWILLCCLLCGCCAAVRRRWHRRRSYNVQYTTRNSIF
ncbi:uncharacterized protein LOC127444298 [Myxocyprinus asiaticus]|uniref:uncharacterized protein LOC127444298 n=1 Tax=Myxocyprinus asiaticus TaxID=70543 RepID=UPI002222566D|nr:uncharacterized protein LOC127444298 [Myxocyprinus asiaticus]